MDKIHDLLNAEFAVPGFAELKSGAGDYRGHAALAKVALGDDIRDDELLTRCQRIALEF